MKTCVQYLDAIKVGKGLSDRGLAIYLGLTPSQLSDYRWQRDVFDDMVSVKVASALQINPLEVISAANYQQANLPEKKAFWQRVSRRYTKPVLGLVNTIESTEGDQR